MVCRPYTISVSSKQKYIFQTFPFNRLEHFNFLTDKYAPSASHYYLKTNELCRKITKWFLTVQSIMYATPGLFLLAAGTVFYYDRDGYVETKKLYMPLQTRYRIERTEWRMQLC